MSGVSLTHGPAGRRRHIWTFAAAFGDVTHTHTDDLPVAAPTLDSIGHSPPQIMWVMTTSVIVTMSILLQQMLMMIYGMGKDVAQAAAAVN